MSSHPLRRQGVGRLHRDVTATTIWEMCRVIGLVQPDVYSKEVVERTGGVERSGRTMRMLLLALAHLAYGDRVKVVGHSPGHTAGLRGALERLAKAASVRHLPVVTGSDIDDVVVFYDHRVKRVAPVASRTARKHPRPPTVAH